MSIVTEKEKIRSLIYDLKDASITNYTENAKILSFNEFPTIKGITSNVLDNTIYPLGLFSWEKLHPNLLPSPLEVKTAILVITAWQGVWIEGEVTNGLKNTGDVEIKNTVQSKLTWIEQRTGGNTGLIKNVSKGFGTVLKNQTPTFTTKFKIGGAVDVLRTLIEGLLTGRITVRTTTEVQGNYNVNGKFLFIFPKSKIETYSKSFNMIVNVPVRSARVEIR